MSGGVLTANGPSTASPAQTPSAQATPTPTPKSAPPPTRRKPMTENWDDDFEFSFPSKPKRGPPPPRREGLVGLGLGIGIEGARGNAGAGTAPKGSPDSFDDEDWDDPLPGPSRLTHASSSSSSSISSPIKQRAPLQLNGIHLHPPRSSHSHSPTLPSPTAASGQGSRRGSPMPPLPLSGSSSVHTPRNSASGSTTPRGHLSKRSSTSFVPVRGESADASSPLSSHSRSPAASSSPNLVGHRPQQFSRDSDFRRVPVPPLPTNIGLGHPSSPSKVSMSSPPKHALSSPTKGQRSPTKRPSSPSKRQFPSSANPTKAKTPELNSSPSTDSLKRPKFWKRFSHGPAAVEAGTASPTRRPRSTSVGNLTPQMSASPPVPPLPPNMRSPSTTSAYSSSSAVSSTPSSHKSVTARRLSAMLRRSSSSLFGQLRESPPPPDIPVPTPPRHPYAIANGSSVNVAGMTFELMSSSNVNLPAMSSPNLLSTPPAMSSPTPLMPSSRHTRAVPSSSSSLHRPSPSRRVSPSSSSALGMAKGTFSPGFHLPSPAAGSPYRQRAGAPSVTSVNNSPLAKDDLSSSDTETEEGSTMPTAPPTRRRVRPTSAMPPPREDVATKGSWKEVNASEPNLSPVNQTIRLPAVSRMEKEASGTFSITSDSSDHGFATSTQSTLRRITSLTRRQGRRLSGGWKFGSASSNSSTESASRPPIPTLGHALETVAGSPSKVLFEEPGSQSASDTATTPKQKRRPTTSKAETFAEGKTPTGPENDRDTWNNSTAKARTKERRRMSFGDFAIPDDVLAKQKDLKRNINAVKKFAGGVEALKQLMVSHERVCDHILHKGTGEDTRHFVALENEYSQWWEMATVLIEVGSTGTEGATPTPQSAGPSSASESNSVRTRRITLATQDARAASEALRNFSGMTHSSLASRKTSGGMSTDSEVDVFNAFGPPRKLQPDHYRASTGRADLSKRQLEVLRTMLQTPVESSDMVVPSVDHKQAAALFVDAPVPKKRVRDPTQRKSMPAVPSNIRRQLAAIDEPSPPCPEAMGFVMPTNYPSPETAAALAQPRPRSGLAGLRDFLRALKKPSHPPHPKPGKITKPKPSTRHRPPPINTEAAEKWHSPPASPLPPAAHEDVLIPAHKGAATLATSPVKTTRKRPNIRHIFRPGSGNWADLVRSPPPSPLVDSHSPHSSDQPGRRSDEVDSGGDQPATQGPPQRPSASRQNSNASSALSRPPSLPALARLKMSKQSGYANLGVDSANPSPTRRGSESMPPLPATPPLPPAPSGVDAAPSSTDNEATLRLKSRVLGLGHPSESSPSRASSSPARPVPTIELASTEDLTPRSRSDTAARVGARDDIVIALTPENLPVLLDYVRQCERKLDEWRARAVTLHGENVL